MSLKKCSDCGAEVSKKAPSCPSCGKPLKGGFISRVAKLLVVSVAIVVLFIYLGSYDQPSSSYSEDNKPVVRKEAVEPDTGKWVFDESIDPIDDSYTRLIALSADIFSSSYGGAPLLVVRCKGGKLDLYINWQDYLGSSPSVAFRIGSSDADFSSWAVSGDGTSSFYTGDVVMFIEKMGDSYHVAAKTTPYNESPVTAQFDIEGFPNAIRPVIKACF